MDQSTLKLPKFLGMPVTVSTFFVCLPVRRLLGMQVYLENHPSFAQLSRETSLAHARSKLSMDIWQAIMDTGVRLRPGFVFQNRTDEERDAEGDTAGYLRLSYATATVSSRPNASLELVFLIIRIDPRTY
jgi:hypothetical protein